MRHLMRHLMLHLADLYDRAPVHDERCDAAWRALARLSREKAKVIRQRLTVMETTDSEPYHSAAVMFDDIRRGEIWVSTANSDHPVWSREDNTAFRLVHDVIGHYAAANAGIPAGFDWQGECNAARFHEQAIPPGDGVRGALTTELLGQTAYRLVHDQFGPQKVAFLW